MKSQATHFTKILVPSKLQFYTINIYAYLLLVCKYNNYNALATGTIITPDKEALFSGPFVCLLAVLHKCYWLDLPQKNQKMGLGSTYVPINF